MMGNAQPKRGAWFRRLEIDKEMAEQGGQEVVPMDQEAGSLRATLSIVNHPSSFKFGYVIVMGSMLAKCSAWSRRLGIANEPKLTTKEDFATYGSQAVTWGSSMKTGGFIYEERNRGHREVYQRRLLEVPTFTGEEKKSDNEAMDGFRPLSYVKVVFDDEAALEKKINYSGDQIAGIRFEPIQGEAGVIIPPDGYLKVVMDLCLHSNILMIADEKLIGEKRRHVFDPGGGAAATGRDHFLPGGSIRAYTVKDLKPGGLDDDVQGLAGGGVAGFYEIISFLHLEDKVNFEGEELMGS